MAGSTGPQPLIYQLQFRDTSAHGRLFRQEMKRINAEGPQQGPTNGPTDNGSNGPKIPSTRAE